MDTKEFELCLCRSAENALQSAHSEIDAAIFSASQCDMRQVHAAVVITTESGTPLLTVSEQYGPQELKDSATLKLNGEEITVQPSRFVWEKIEKGATFNEYLQYIRGITSPNNLLLRLGVVKELIGVPDVYNRPANYLVKVAVSGFNHHQDLKMATMILTTICLQITKYLEGWYEESFKSPIPLYSGHAS